MLSIITKYKIRHGQIEHVFDDGVRGCGSVLAAYDCGHPAIDACVALSELMHSRLSGETLEHAIEVSKASITTVAMLEMTQAGREMTDEELKENPAVEQEWDIQWEIFRLLADCEERDI